MRKQAGIEGVRIHDLWHSYASHALGTATIEASITLSMATTPLAFKAGDWLNARLGPEAKPEYERHFAEENRVIIAGFGRVGQIVGRILQARRIGFTAIEASAEQVDFVRRFGNKIYYGDASRVELLRVDPRVALLPRGEALFAGQQDGAAHGLAVRCSAGCPGPSAPAVPMGLPGRRLAHPVGLAGSLLAACEERSRPGGCPSA